MRVPESWRHQLAQRIAPARAWYRQREPREQRALLLLAAALAVAAFWWLVWQPLYEGRSQAREGYVRATQTLDWIRANAPAVRESRQDSSSPASADEDWTSRINSSASAHELTLKGFTPEGPDQVRVMLETQPFARVIAWLQTLQSEQGVQASNIEISKSNSSGKVNVRATLTRGS